MRVEIEVETSQMLGTKSTTEINPKSTADINPSSVLNLNKGLDGMKKISFERECVYRYQFLVLL